MAGRRFVLACLLPLLGACNMAISETPMFAEIDAVDLKPKQGIWLADDPECRFDSASPEADWPDCAMWLVVGNSGDVLLKDGKDQTQAARYMIAKGQPPIVQVLWRDDAKEDGKTFYVFFGLEPVTIHADGTFVSAGSWEVKCGTKQGSDIEPYPGVSAECRPSSQDAIRSAAVASRPSAEMAMAWRWLRTANR